MGLGGRLEDGRIVDSQYDRARCTIRTNGNWVPGFQKALGLALDEVRQRIDSIRNLPQDAERPVIQKITNYSLVTSIMVSTENGSLEELRPLVRNMEDEILALGAGKVDFLGLPEEERPDGCTSDRLPRTIQERAWTSPIVYAN